MAEINKIGYLMIDLVRHRFNRIIFALPFAFFVTCLVVLLYFNSRTNLPIDESVFEEIPTPTQTSTAQSAVAQPTELPFGGTLIYPNYRFIALYGSPEHKGLGSLGEQSIDESVARIKALSELYSAQSDDNVIPTFEIITTIASAGLTENNDYSQETDINKIWPWVNSAKEHDMYVVLDFQPGRNSFLQQAMQYEELFLEPHVGLALDPEWRLQTETDRHLKKVGSVTAAELNETSEWLADLVKSNNLPQKIFMIHQFKPSMIQNRETLKTDREELSYIIHVDGFGTLGQKKDTWNRMKENLPKNMSLGWKNFYDEDQPTPTPEETMSQEPQPHFISYQ